MSQLPQQASSMTKTLKANLFVTAWNDTTPEQLEEILRDTLSHEGITVQGVVAWEVNTSS